MPALWLIQAGRGAGLAILLAVTLWQFAYLTMAIRRFYFADDTASLRRTLSAVAAALFIYLLNSAFLTGVQMLGTAVALRRL